MRRFFVGKVGETVITLTLSVVAAIAFGTEERNERYSRLILSEKGLAGYWRMEENLTDSKSNCSGVARGGTVRFVDGIGGGKALALGEGQFVIVENTAHLDLSETTVECFFKLTATPENNACLVAKRSEKETRFSIHVSRDMAQLLIWNGRAVIPADFPVAPLDVGQWYYLAVTADKDGLGVYLDGVPCGRIRNRTFNFAAEGLPLLFGAATPSGYEQCVCAMDEIAVYSRVLTESEVDRHLAAIGWAEKKKALLKKKETLLEQKLAQERERRRRKMEVLDKWMNDLALLSPGKTRTYQGEHLTAINFPLGGIGAGCLQINGNAEKAIWQIFNNFSNAFIPHTFFAVRSKADNHEPIVRALQTKAVGPFEGMRSLTFRGEYPLAWYDFEDPALPVTVSMEAFTPLIPMEARDSAIPCAIFNLTARNPSDKNIEVSFLATQQNGVGFTDGGNIEGRLFDGYGGNINRIIRDEGATLLHMTSNRKKDSAVFGDMALAMFEKDVAATASWDTLQTLWTDLSEDGSLSGSESAGPSPAGQTLDGALSFPVVLEPGESRTITLVLAWYFPNATHGRDAWGGKGNMYANWCGSALDVTRDVRRRFDELSRLTRLYHDSLYASNLPRWLLDRISSQVAVLRSKTCFWTKEGYFGGWEGCSPASGCCHGNCAHVWHYAQAHARLFPSIARRMREESLGHQTADGRIPFRQPAGGAATDGQCGEILEAYREHLCSADSDWLEEHWPRVRKATEYVIATWDKDQDGVLSGPQHNTLDAEAGGSTSWLGTLYLSALAASEKMARLQGDGDDAERFRRIRNSGARQQNETLWNGEYYIQIPGPQPYRDYDNGCHIDQVLGEWWANQVQLDTHYPVERVRSALRSLLKYNFRTNFRGIPQTPRKFVSDEDAGMQMITWPMGPRPQNHMIYADEAMTGFEYAAAATMIQYGMLEEGFVVTKAISDRYDGRIRTGLTATDYSSWGYSGNPFGDDECGKFYARAMSVWSVLLACQGFLYDGPAGVIGFRPVWRPDDHATFFTVAEGWGVFTQTRHQDRQSDRVELKQGTLRVKTLVFELPEGMSLGDVTVTVADKVVNARATQAGTTVTITLPREIVLNRDEPLEVSITPKT